MKNIFKELIKETDKVNELIKKHENEQRKEKDDIQKKWIEMCLKIGELVEIYRENLSIEHDAKFSNFKDSKDLKEIYLTWKGIDFKVKSDPILKNKTLLTNNNIIEETLSNLINQVKKIKKILIKGENK